MLCTKGTKFPTNLKKSLFKENGSCCKICDNVVSKKRFLEVHHIYPKEYGGLGNRNNALVLCNKCHAKLHKVIAYKSNIDEILARTKTFIESFGKRSGDILQNFEFYKQAA